MVKLANRQKRIQVLNIPCVLDENGKCTHEDCLCSEVVTQIQVELPDGTRGLKLLERRLPGSITILAEKSVEVPAWMADAPDVKAAVAQGRVRLVKE